MAAEILQALHHGPAPLVLPNAWDPVSAAASLHTHFTNALRNLLPTLG
jgi:2-methylisocitrate lyase-like PEP mutase family enzyme